jgi:toxin FitB
VTWLQGETDADLHIAAVTIGELQAGVELTREQDPGRAAEIEV